MLIYTVTPWQISNKFCEQRFPSYNTSIESHPWYTSTIHRTHTMALYRKLTVCARTRVKSNVTKTKCSQHKDSRSVKWHFPPYMAPESCTYKYHMSLNHIQRQFNPVHVHAPHSLKFHSNHILSVPIFYVAHIQYFGMSPCIVHLYIPSSNHSIVSRGASYEVPFYTILLFIFSWLGTNILHSTLFSYTHNVTFLTLRGNITVNPRLCNYSCHIQQKQTCFPFSRTHTSLKHINHWYSMFFNYMNSW